MTALQALFSTNQASSDKLFQLSFEAKKETALQTFLAAVKSSSISWDNAFIVGVSQKPIHCKDWLKQSVEPFSDYFDDDDIIDAVERGGNSNYDVVADAISKMFSVMDNCNKNVEQPSESHMAKLTKILYDLNDENPDEEWCAIVICQLLLAAALHLSDTLECARICHPDMPEEFFVLHKTDDGKLYIAEQSEKENASEYMLLSDVQDIENAKKFIKHKNPDWTNKRVQQYVDSCHPSIEILLSITTKNVLMNLIAFDIAFFN